MGFALVVEMLIKRMKQVQVPIVGHNMIYDIIFLYNQFIAPLPETYDEFVREWNRRFPLTFDTKVLAFNAQYFGRTILGKIYEKCEADKKLKDILRFQFDKKNGFKNYVGASLLERYHEAAYDAYMTGYVFAKIVKFKEIDAIYHQNRNNKNPKAVKESPYSRKDKEIDLKLQFASMLKNKVMLNQFENCACFHMNPDKPDQAALQIEEKNKQAVWIQFHESLEAESRSAEKLSEMFQPLGDFQLYKDTHQSSIVLFYHIEKEVVGGKEVSHVIDHLLTKMSDIVKKACTYNEAPKFTAHNLLDI